MVDFPVRGQRAPQYWDEQLQEYIDAKAAEEDDASVLVVEHPDGKVDITTSDASPFTLTDNGETASIELEGTTVTLATPRLGGPPFLLSSFVGNTAAESAVSMFTSVDGVDWRSNNANPVLTAASGIRDPSIAYIRGAWYVAGTTATIAAPTSTSFKVWRSTDPLRAGSWTLVATIDCSAAMAGPGTDYCWAPDFFVDDDGEVYITISLEASSLWYVRATSPDLSTWTAPALLLAPGTSVIDSHTYRIGDTYHLFFKGPGGYFHHATSASPMSGYTVQQTGNWMGFPTVVTPTNGYEGPVIVQVGASRWRMYVDYVDINAGLHYTETSDPTLASGWTALTACTLDGLANGAKLRHGTVVGLAGLDTAAALMAPRTTKAVPGKTFGSGIRTAGGITVNSVSPAWQFLDTSKDVVLTGCVPGDVIEAHAEFVWAADTDEGHFDIVTVIGAAGGTVGSRFMSQGEGGLGLIGAWGFSSTTFVKAVTTPTKVLTAADINTDGTVRLSMRAQVLAGSRLIYADTSNGLLFRARKI